MRSCFVAALAIIGLLLLTPAARGAEAAAKCPVSPTVRAEAPHEAGVDPLVGDWYINRDKSIWAMHAEEWQEGTETKVPWIRPAHVQLVITGRRLDGNAPALEATTAGNYETRFQPTSLRFPTAGCWEVTGVAGSDRLRFVTRVGPRSASSSSPGGAR